MKCIADNDTRSIKPFTSGLSRNRLKPAFQPAKASVPVRSTRLLAVLLLVLAALFLLSCERKWNNPVDLDNIIMPTICLESGTYYNSIYVRIDHPNDNRLDIYYTLDGTEPNTSSIHYSDSIYIDQTSTLKAIAIADQNRSSTVSASYSFQVARPSFSPDAGYYPPEQSVSIDCVTEGAAIYYTTDGSEPNESSMLYSAHLSISETTTLKTRAYKTQWTASEIFSVTYSIIPIGLVYLPGGTFTMGDTHGVGWSYELPTHSVTLNSFYMGKYEVTQAEYAQYMQPSSSWTSSNGLGDNYPAYYISWYAILKYCNLRSMAEGLTPVYTISGSTDPANWGEVPTSNNNSTWDAAICNWSANGYRLPTEAEWEYAARGATNTPDYLYSGSDDINTVAWYEGNNTPNGTKPVGTKAPNGLGLYDMSGNVWEWCWDWYSATYYSSSPSNNPTGPSSGSGRVVRGGYWYYSASYCRVANRNVNLPYGSYSLNGFRVLRSGL